ncbi:uncharacterized protein [Venturia canescens]|uniref:uncharacterized protein n=1 Tax=Venturia canescens TaxID=32260 RepID=UPI001C9D08C1|nr:uncharacterized protein LOC122416760 [Venturia canescens]
MTNYYSKCVKNYSEIVGPLYELLQKNSKWECSNLCDEAFRKVKRRLVESEVLVHYNPELPIKISCDASPFGLGAVLSHVFPDESERPVTFASRTLNKAEKNYSQLDKEALGLIFAVQAIDVEIIREETNNDPILSHVRDYVLNGWPYQVNNNLKAFKSRERKLTAEQGCVLWGHRFVIPQSLRDELLNELHTAHDGIVRMKAVARSYIWWPNLDKDIENIGMSCISCLKATENPPRAKLNSWKRPSGPNRRLHADFLGPIEDKMYIVIIDAFSKWIDIKELENITSGTTIEVFRENFCAWGLPVKLVTDNGPSFCSKEFSEFLKSYGQTSQQSGFRGNRQVDFRKNETVMAKDYSSSVDNWKVSQIREQITPVTYTVFTEDNKTWKRHVDQIKKCNYRVSDKSEAKSIVGAKPTDNSTDIPLEPSPMGTETETPINSRNNPVENTSAEVAKKKKN